MSFAAKDATGATVQLAQPMAGPGPKAGGILVALPTDSDHARTADITSLSTEIIGALTPNGGLPVALQGTVAVTQSGSWTVGLSPGATVALVGGNTVALKVDGSATTQPVSGTVTVGTLPTLPAGSNKIGSVDVASLPATAAKDATIAQVSTDLNAGLGADGASPPAIAGIGVRGWLRAIYERLAGTLTVGGSVNVSNLPATQVVSATALPLPTGAATAAAQGSGNTSLSSIDGKVPTLVSGRTPVDGSGVTQPVSATALPLPAGAATGTKQDTGNTSLSNIDGKVPAKGQAAMAASTPVAIASDQSPVPVAQAATAAYTVQRTNSIGTTGTLVSAADTTNRRTVRNTGSIALEFVAQGAAYGTGHPLPVGESFTFDNGGRMTGAIYLAAASAGGAASVMSF